MISNIDIVKISRRLISKLPVEYRPHARELVNNASYKVFKQDNFTIVTLLSNDGRVVGAGAAKRMPTDFESDVIGINIALVRAIKHAFSKISHDDVIKLVQNDVM